MLNPDALRLPLIAAPMFLVSGPSLVSACCRAGVIGTFPALNQRTSEGFGDWLDEIDAALSDIEHPGYGVNLIVHQSNPRLEADLERIVEHRVPLVITSLGAVPSLVEAVHAYGGQVFHDVVNLRHARKAADAGVDGLIAVSAGAGGHAGTLHPFSLMSEIRRFFEGTLILSGALSRGRDILAARAAGADYAYMGTRFLCTTESLASPEYKAMVMASAAADIVYTDKVSGVPANFIKASLEAAVANGLLGADALHSDDATGNAQLKALENEAKAWRDIWSAGHGVGQITDCPGVAELVSELRADYDESLARLSAERWL